MDVLSKSKRIVEALNSIKIYTPLDVLLHLPYRYEDYSLTRETDLDNKEHVVIKGKITSDINVSRFNKVNLVKFDLLSINHHLFVINAWNRDYLRFSFKRGDEVTLAGVYDKNKRLINLSSIFKGDVPDKDKLKPVYSLPQALSNYEFISLVNRSFKSLEKTGLNDDLPKIFKIKYRLLPKLDSLKLIHKPTKIEDVYQGLRILKYEECLHFTLKSKMIREENSKLEYSSKKMIDLDKSREFIKQLPYKLTHDQKIAIREIIFDMNKNKLMYRLLQGDVGTGKTLVAMVALHANYLRGSQGAFMAPTDALAKQHYHNLVKLFKPFNINVVLLSGSSSTKERSVIRKALINGEIDILVGTHILFSKDINYLSLGLVIIDEQQKFGVNQRIQLLNKGDNADLLLMSATPIPRTLALSLYGDMDVSSLSEFPCEKRDIVTKIIKEKDPELLSSINDSLSNNKRVYIVAPKIIENDNETVSVEELYAKYLLRYPGKVALLHGNLDEDEKDFALSDFIKGDCPILIATSVIEVGIDVKDANLMIIYDPNHFGLANLHQLRGRIGRDGSKSKCLLVYDDDDEDTLDKLNVLVRSNDGFYISEEDLRRRGAGELTGVKQSGIANFTYVNLVNDIKIFQAAQEDAKYVVAHAREPEYYNYLKNIKLEIENERFQKLLS